LRDIISLREGCRPFVVAEAGINYDGELDKALALVEAAARAGCDAIKFQIFDARMMYDEPEATFFRRFELAPEQWAFIAHFAEQRGILFMATPDELESAKLIAELSPVIKIGSADLRDKEFLYQVAQLNRHMIISTGAATDGEIGEVAKLMAFEPHMFLHCTSSYPANLDTLNLGAIRTMGQRYNVAVGWSDHTTGVMSRALHMALGAGARVFEKHFTLWAEGKSPDHKMSICGASQMASYVQAIILACDVLGSGVREVQDCEKTTRAKGEQFMRKRAYNAVIDRHLRQFEQSS